MPENELGRPMPELGKIEQVDMRLIWPHEAHDFTPWLANRLDLLGDPLGMELELVQREADIGGFSLDILAQKRDTGELVAIENQLEWADHPHLGKLLTYAAALDARVVIWVASSFRGEHRATIDWLNDWTPEEINFYGVEVKRNQDWRVAARSRVSPGGVPQRLDETKGGQRGFPVQRGPDSVLPASR